MYYIPIKFLRVQFTWLILHTCKPWVDLFRIHLLASHFNPQVFPQSNGVLIGSLYLHSPVQGGSITFVLTLVAGGIRFFFVWTLDGTHLLQLISLYAVCILITNTTQHTLTTLFQALCFLVLPPFRNPWLRPCSLHEPPQVLLCLRRLCLALPTTMHLESSALDLPFFFP